MTDDEIARRRPVWAVLTELFLDTDVSLFDARISGVLRASGFSADEAEHVLRDEVGPVFYGNLLDIAGEWSGWPDEWVTEKVLKHLAAPVAVRAATKLLSNPVIDRLVDTDWRRIKTLTWGAT